MKLYYAETLNPRKACPVARYLNAPVEFAHINDCQGREPHARVSRTQPQRQGPLDTGKGVLWESNAIMCFLARAAGSDLWPTDDRQCAG